MPKWFRIADKFQRWRFKSRPRASEPKGVLLLSSGGLGDTILFSHVIHAFQAYAKPGEKVTVLLRKDGAKTSFLFPDEVATYVVDFNRYRTDLSHRREINSQLYEANYRAVISTDYLRHPDLDESLMLAAQAAETIAMVAKPWKKYQAQLDAHARHLTRVFESGPARQDKLLRWYKFADWLTSAINQPRLGTYRHKKAPPSAAQEAGSVYIQPFSAVKAKQCHADVYEALIKALTPSTPVFLTGAPGEMDANPEFKRLLELPNVSFDDCGFEELFVKLQTAALVVSVDTAVMHLSVVAGAPTLCIASAAYVGEIVPYADQFRSDRVDFYYKSMGCEGCLGDCIKPLNAQRYQCIAELESQTVVSRALALIEQSSRVEGG